MRRATHRSPGPDGPAPAPSGPGAGTPRPVPGTSRPPVTPAGHDTGPAGVTFPALGTVASVLVTDPGARDAAAAMLAAELSAIDAACSRFRADSELSRLNRAGGRELTISPLLTEALATALTAARATDGDVDPTCGRSLIGLGYDRDFAEVRRGAGPRRDRQSRPRRAGWPWNSTRRGGWPGCRTAWCSTSARPPRPWRLTAPPSSSRSRPAAASWSTWAGTSGWPAAAGRRLAHRDRGRRGLRRRPARQQARPRGHHHQRRPRHLQPPGPGLAPGHSGTASHRPARYRPARRHVLARGERDRRQLRGRERGQHGRDHPRRAGPAVAGQPAPAGPAGPPRRDSAGGGRLAGGARRRRAGAVGQVPARCPA